MLERPTHSSTRAQGYLQSRQRFVFQRPVGGNDSPPAAMAKTSTTTIRLLLRCCLLWCLICQRLDATAVCGGPRLGQPRVRDCILLTDKLPYAHNAALTVPRAFVEPQFLFSPFCSVPNPYPLNTMVQLPKIWRNSKF